MEAGDFFYLQAFWDLCSCRDLSGGFGPIPWTAIERYAEVYRLAFDVKLAFIRILRELDRAYLDHKQAEINAKQASAGTQKRR
ncbi:tail chaperonin [Pseudomonas phage RSP]|nr:tail chaperonin [Pseudomonas phage RSP]